MASSRAKIADLDNQYGDDRVLRSYLERVLPPTVRTDVEPELRELGAFTAGPLYDLQLEDRPDEPPNDGIRANCMKDKLGARRFALTLGPVFELSLLARHAQWALSGEGSRAAVVEHFAAQGVDHTALRQHDGAYLLAQDLSTQSLFVTPEVARNGQ